MPRHRSLLLASALLLAALCVSAFAQQSTITIVNRSAWDVHHLFLSPVDDDEWGPDQLGDQIIPAGGTFQLYGISCDVYDIMVVAGAAQLHKLAYALDAVLNVDWIDETLGAAPTADHIDYEYDGVDRLTQADFPGPDLVDEDYQYDQAGNRDDDPSSGAWTYDPNNRIQASPGLTWAFDDDGNLETKNAAQPNEERFTFNHVNRLVGWEKDVGGSLASEASYRYDPFGRRIQKVVDGAVTWFLWDGDQLLAEFDGSGVRTRRYTYAGGYAPAQVVDPAGGGLETV